MKIVGFGQTVRLTPIPKTGFEIRVLDQEGKEVAIPASEETVKALLALLHKPIKDEDVSLPDEDDNPGVEEVFGGDVAAMGGNLASSGPEVEEDYPETDRPAFLKKHEDADEDGQQI